MKKGLPPLTKYDVMVRRITYFRGIEGVSPDAAKKWAADILEDDPSRYDDIFFGAILSQYASDPVRVRHSQYPHELERLDDVDEDDEAFYKDYRDTGGEG